MRLVIMEAVPDMLTVFHDVRALLLLPAKFKLV